MCEYLGFDYEAGRKRIQGRAAIRERVAANAAAYFGRDMATKFATLLARLSDRVQANDTARREIERLNEIVES